MTQATGMKVLAPLRGVTIRCFRTTFATEIAAAGFTEAITPFVSANAGVDPLKDRELAGCTAFASGSVAGLCVTPQFIGKDPAALRSCLLRIREAGFETADLNCGCPYPMVRNKGRGSGILRTPQVLERMIAAGCETMGAGRFSVKVRLGIDRSDELLALMPMLNAYPLRFLTVHARTARQMYEGACDWAAYARIVDVARMPLVRNGDVAWDADATVEDIMVGRSFIRALGARDDAADAVRRYVTASQAELCGDRPVLGRMKELLAYWKDLPRWHRRWNLIKICRSVDELLGVLG